MTGMTHDEKLAHHKKVALTTLTANANAKGFLGAELLQAQDALGVVGWAQLQDWLKDTCGFTNSDIQLAIDIYVGKVNVRLASVGVAAEKLRRVTVRDQDALCNDDNKFGIKQPDMTIVEKAFFEMTHVERNQLIDRAGRILPPELQIIKSPKTRVVAEADAIEFDGRNKLRIKSGKTCIAVNVDVLKELLRCQSA